MVKEAYVQLFFNKFLQLKNVTVGRSNIGSEINEVTRSDCGWYCGQSEMVNRFND